MSDKAKEIVFDACAVTMLLLLVFAVFGIAI